MGLEVIMSAMTQMEPLVERPRATSLAVTKAIPKKTIEQSTEMHPLVPVLIAAFIAFNLSCAAIGPIVLWLWLRHSGVVAP